MRIGAPTSIRTWRSRLGVALAFAAAVGIGILMAVLVGSLAVTPFG
jgi:hypothetical protein